MTDSRICLGRVGAPYGIKGWVKLISFTQPRENLLDYRRFSARRLDGSETLLQMDDAKPHGKGLIGHFAGYDTPEAVRDLTNLELYVAAGELPQLADGDYYWYQLTGLNVWSTSGVWLGVLSNMLETGANDVMVVEPVEGSIDDNRRLIPWLPDRVVVSVDIPAGKIVVDWEADYLV